MRFDEVWFQYIRDNPERSWSWSAISNNPILSGSDLPRRYPRFPWKWQTLVCQMTLGRDMFDVEDYAWNNVDPTDLATDWYFVSAHTKLPIQVVLENPSYPWHWYHVSQNVQLTWDIIEENSHLPWDWSGLSANPMTLWRSRYVEDTETDTETDTDCENENDILMDTVD